MLSTTPLANLGKSGFCSRLTKWVYEISDNTITRKPEALKTVNCINKASVFILMASFKREQENFPS